MYRTRGSAGNTNANILQLGAANVELLEVNSKYNASPDTNLNVDYTVEKEAFITIGSGTIIGRMYAATYAQLNLRPSAMGYFRDLERTDVNDGTYGYQDDTVWGWRSPKI